MDKIKTYQDIVKKGLKEYAAWVEEDPPELDFEVALAFDDEHGQYILREIGWTEKTWIRETRLHLTLHKGKIWIEIVQTEQYMKAGKIAADF